MNIDKKYVSYLVYFGQFSYKGAQMSYIWHEVLDKLYWFMIYVPT